MPLTVCVLVAFVFLCPHFMSVSCVFVVLFCFLNIAEAQGLEDDQTVTLI